MQYAVSDVNHHDRYKILTAFVLPRPIAWVTTLGPTGVVNAAPFSFFNVFAEDPPLVMFACNKRPDGRLKDTWLNIQRTGQFVVNLTDEPLARAMHDSSGDFPPDIGEPDYLGLGLAPSVDIKPPRLADAPWSMECRTWQVINVKDDRQLVIGEGLRFHIRDELWDPKAMRVHMEKYHPVGRMFADRYCRTDDRIVYPCCRRAEEVRRRGLSVIASARTQAPKARLRGMAEYSSQIAVRPAGRGWPRWLAALLVGVLLLLTLLIASWFLRACAPVDPSVNLTALETPAPPAPPPPIDPTLALKASLDEGADDEKKLKIELAALQADLRNKVALCKPVEPPKPPPPPPPVAKAPPPPRRCRPTDGRKRTSACCRAAGGSVTIRRATSAWAGGPK